MSGFIGAAQPQNVIVVDDQRTAELSEGTFDFGLDYPALSPSVDPLALASYVTPWWPAGCPDFGATLGVLFAESHWEPYPVSGSNGRYAIVGYTRDAYGSPVAGVTVKLFRTLDDSLQTTVTSDGNGRYVATSAYADAHYAVVRKAGPPDLCGCTLDTLTPT